MNRGRLIVFEGGEASGKSTQAARLAADLGALLTREPGGTAVGERIRAVVLDPDAGVLDRRAEALLLAADRAQHVAEVVEPTLARGEDVVSDRFIPSSLAYQGYGRGLDLDELRRLSAWASAGLEPDLVILLDVPPDVARARRAAAADPERWVVVDGTGDVDEVAKRVREAAGALIR